MNIECTIVNIEDIIAVIGEEVTFELPVHNILPVGVLDADGNLLGYLGRNDVTMVPGSVSGQDVCQLLENGWHIDGATVKYMAYHKTAHRKAVIELELSKIREIVFA